MGIATVKAKEYVSRVNQYKQSLANAAKDVPVREFIPLKVSPHPQQARIDEFKAIPSLYSAPVRR